MTDPLDAILADAADAIGLYGADQIGRDLAGVVRNDPRTVEWLADRLHEWAEDEPCDSGDDCPERPQWRRLAAFILAEPDRPTSWREASRQMLADGTVRDDE